MNNLANSVIYKLKKIFNLKYLKIEISIYFIHILHWGECEVVRLFLNNRLFNQELPFEMGDCHGR
jgi:hypothetical protein